MREIGTRQPSARNKDFFFFLFILETLIQHYRKSSIEHHPQISAILLNLCQSEVKFKARSGDLHKIDLLIEY